MTLETPLPSYDSPPVTEVVLGVQFDTIHGFASPHIGLAWEKFRTLYPRVEEHPPLAPAFELFGSGPHSGSGMTFVMPFAAPRVFFLNEPGTELHQVQSDRFLHNWRRLNTNDEYPRFAHLRNSFVDGYKKLEATLVEAGLTKLVPNQCEISYVNQLEGDTEPALQEVASGLFEGMDSRFALKDVGAPEDIRLMVRYQLVNPETKVAVGRLSVSREPVFRADGRRAIQLSLTVRGTPATASLDGVIEFLELGRAAIVKSFTNITNNKLHTLWGRME